MCINATYPANFIKTTNMVTVMIRFNMQDVYDRQSKLSDEILRNSGNMEFLVVDWPYCFYWPAM